MAAVSLIQQPRLFVIGLGWLGLSLCAYYKNKSFSIGGTVRSVDKQKSIASLSPSSCLFNLYNGDSSLNDNRFITDIVHKSDWRQTTLLLAIPPGRRNVNTIEFSHRMKSLIDHFASQNIKSIIFISTSSVYGNTHGIVNNLTPTAPITQSAIAHIEIERHLFANYKQVSCVLRLSGLVGPNPDGSFRHPIYTLCKKDNIAKGRDPVNLIHQADVIQAINSIVLKDKVDFQSAVLSSLEQPSREEYYSWCARFLSLPSPKFLKDDSDRPLSKLIDASQTYRSLGITPMYKSPYDMLKGYRL